MPIADSSTACGIIDTQNDGGGWPELKSAPAANDTDQDGMPDQWETENGLNPNEADDRNCVTADGDTMLQRHLNSIEQKN